MALRGAGFVAPMTGEFMNWFFKRFGAGGDSGAKPSAATKTCPECGSQLMLADSVAEPVCSNPDCPAQVRRGLAHWCAPEVMDLPGADAALIALLVGRGLVRDVAELYRLKVSELAALPGGDEVAARKFWEAIAASRQREVWRLLFGLEIPLVGAAEARLLATGFPTVGAVFAAGAPRLMQDAGVSAAVAESVIRWHSDSVNRRLVKRLQQAGLNFKSELCPPPG